MITFTREQVELAEMVLTLIKHYPAHLQQETWFDSGAGEPLDMWFSLDEALSCGTVGCFAGWTVFVSGHAYNEFTSLVDTGETIQEFAARVLGLSSEDHGRIRLGTRWTGRHVFNGCNTLNDLQGFVAAMRAHCPELATTS